MIDKSQKVKISGTRNFKDYIFAVGRRGSAIARVRVYLKAPDNLKFEEYIVKKGDMVVNGKLISEYFSGVVNKSKYEEPFKVTDTTNKYAVTAKVTGGGMQSQLGAFVLGISRCLAAIDENNKPILRKSGFMTRDSRVRERRKVGMGGKARRKRQSPKR